jgi:hypothetical protein
MANGRTDEHDIPCGTQVNQRRQSVWGLFGETHLGPRSFAPHQVEAGRMTALVPYAKSSKKFLRLWDRSTHVPLNRLFRGFYGGAKVYPSCLAPSLPIVGPGMGRNELDQPPRAQDLFAR